MKMLTLDKFEEASEKVKEVTLETIDDLQKFDPDEFVNALFDVKNKEDNDEDADAR